MEREGMKGVVFPLSADGRRSTSALGRAVVADALRPVDAAGALGAEQETNWRSGYLVHFRRLVEAGLASKAAALSIARHGAGSLHARMRVNGPDGQETGLDALLSAPAQASFATLSVPGAAPPETGLTLPYRGERLAGDSLARRLDTWVNTGIIEPSCADAVREVAAHPEWLPLPGRTVIALGAAAEVGPVEVLLRWGARVAALDLPSPPAWERVLGMARCGAGTLLVPVTTAAPASVRADGGAEAITRWAGLDLDRQVPAAADWLAGLDGPLVLGNYVYADGAANVAVCAAADALTARLQAARDDLALAFLATPTDVYAVPAEAVAHSARAYASRPRTVRLAGRPLRTLSGGRLLRRAYVPGADPGVCDSLVSQQGPNYALAKRLQRWRATLAREAGATVSLNIAPPTRTRSVVKNRVLAAAYAGAHRFGAEVFEPATTRTLMAALLVHDLQTAAQARAHPWQDEADGAAHGGLWRIAYAPRSALVLAAILGYGAARP
ncbi:MAG TPA: hypothetical protein VMF87_20085 [Streptosporangiaceae bacterium]|nr:hypothetical protein [Streptosporangiaceae bacterium]